MAAISATAWSVDGACETVHGFLVARDVTVPSLRPRRPTRTRRRDLGELFFAQCRHRLLDERRFHLAGSIRSETNIRSLAYVPALALQRRLFHRRQISLIENRHRRLRRTRRLATVHAGTFAKRARSGPCRVRRFYRGLVSHLQIQREDGARE